MYIFSSWHEGKKRKRKTPRRVIEGESRLWGAIAAAPVELSPEKYATTLSERIHMEICHHPIEENTQRTSLRNMPPTYLRNTRACLIWELCHRPNQEIQEHPMYHLRDMPPLYQKKCTYFERDITPPFWKEYTITLFGEFVTSEKYITTRSKRATTHSKRYVATLSKRNTYSTPYPKNTPPSYLKYMPPPYRKIL